MISSQKKKAGYVPTRPFKIRSSGNRGNRDGSRHAVGDGPRRRRRHASPDAFGRTRPSTLWRRRSGAADSNAAHRLRPRQRPRPDARAWWGRGILRRLVLWFLPRSLRTWARHGRIARDGGGDVRRVLHGLVADFWPFPAAPLGVLVLRPFSPALRAPRAALLP